MTGEYPKTIATVNGAVRKLGLPVRAIRGRGYYYWLSDDGDPLEPSVNVVRASDLPMEHWLECARAAFQWGVDIGYLDPQNGRSK